MVGGASGVHKAVRAAYGGICAAFSGACAACCAQSVELGGASGAKCRDRAMPCGRREVRDGTRAFVPVFWASRGCLSFSVWFDAQSPNKDMFHTNYLHDLNQISYGQLGGREKRKSALAPSTVNQARRPRGPWQKPRPRMSHLEARSDRLSPLPPHPPARESKAASSA